MQTTEELLLRLGIDSRAVSTGLQRVTSLIRGWATSIGHHLRGALGGFFAFAAIERGFERIKERILFIRRMTNETGFNSNFIQGAMRKLELEGESGEKLAKPLAAITAMAGAKGMTAVQYISLLADRYEKLNTQEARNLMLQQLGIKNWQTLIPLLEHGARGIEEMSKGNFFTKLTDKTIDTVHGFERFGKIFQMIGTTAANIFGFIMHGTGREKAMYGDKKSEEENKKKESGLLSAEQKEAQAEINQLLEKQLDLKNQLLDVGKKSISQLAAEARHLTGHKPIHHTMTARLRTAMRVEDLEDRAERDWERGIVDNPKDSKFFSEAQQIRKSNSNWLSAKDSDPTRQTNFLLQQLNDKIDSMVQPVAAAGKVSEQILEQHKQQ